MLYWIKQNLIVMVELNNGSAFMQKLPVGISDFGIIRSGDYYFVDKSLFIKEIFDSGAAATLIPRPRRFGKTTNLSMLKYFFEKTTTSNIGLFDGLKISKHHEFMANQGKYPVIFLTFKDVKQYNWNDCYNMLVQLISEEFRRHNYLLSSDVLDSTQKKDFENIINRIASMTVYQNSLKNLSESLAKYHKQNPIILIDEYDTPIQAGFYHKYYDKIISFSRGFLSGGLKDNASLQFSVITGILRIAKESIFSGLNNLSVCSMLSSLYSDKFGMTETEVADAMAHYNLSNKIEDVKSWYNGYATGSKINVYNPWSIINLIKNNGEFEPFWVNTSSNDIVKDLIQHGSDELKEDFEALIKRESIRKAIEENIVFADLVENKATNAVWSFLIFSGYLTFKNAAVENGQKYADLLIPNDEVAWFYRNVINSWCKNNIGEKRYNLMLNSLISGEVEKFKELFTDFVLKSFSMFDVSGQEPEKFYHAFVLGMLVSLGNEYVIRSNRESGLGRYDVMLIPNDKNKLGIIIEFKKRSQYQKETLEQAVVAALEQIEDKKYAQELNAFGIKKILKLGIAFQGKSVLIKERY